MATDSDKKQDFSVKIGDREYSVTHADDGAAVICVNKDRGNVIGKERECDLSIYPRWANTRIFQFIEQLDTIL